MKAIILAAGFKTALDPSGEEIPLLLIRLGDKTLLDHWTRKLDRFPVLNEIIVISNQKFFPKFREWQKQSAYRKPIRLIHNGCDEPGKRSGALRDLELALRSSSGTPETFLVFCGNHDFDFPVGYFLLPCLGHPNYTFIGLYETREKAVASQCAVAEMDTHGKIIRFEEKPADPASTNVSAGVYYIPATARLLLREYLIRAKRQRPERISDFMAWFAGREPVYGVVLEGAWLDAGIRRSQEKVTQNAS